MSWSIGTFPRALVAEVEVVPDHHGLGLEAADEDFPDELLGRLLRPVLIEMHDQDVVDAGRGQKLELLIEVGEQFRRRLGPHDRSRVLIESDDGGRQVLLRRRPLDPVDDEPVTGVDTVVGPDRHRARPIGGAIPRVVEHFHPDRD